MNSRRALMIGGRATTCIRLGSEQHFAPPPRRQWAAHLAGGACERMLGPGGAIHCNPATFLGLLQRPLAPQARPQLIPMSAALSTRTVRVAVASAARLQPALRTLRAAWAAPRQQVQQQRGAAAARIVRAAAETETAGALLKHTEPLGVSCSATCSAPSSACSLPCALAGSPAPQPCARCPNPCLRSQRRRPTRRAACPT